VGGPVVEKRGVECILITLHLARPLTQPPVVSLQLNWGNKDWMGGWWGVWRAGWPKRLPASWWVG